MKVLLVNGSSKKNRCTYTALSEAARSLEAEGIDTEIVWIGSAPVRGCTACNHCFESRSGRCVFDDDIVNELLDKAEAADGIIVGSPVYYAGMNGALKAVMDRMFYAGAGRLRFKPAAGIASARRAGTTPTIDQINKYFLINCMPVVSSNYWSMVHGREASDVLQDEEGLQIMRVLGKNMAWLLKSIEAAKAAGVGLPDLEPKVMTCFIR